MLTSIKLTNFKKHKNLEVNFTEGLNVVKGPNFCGKSTVLKAVAVALYGITGAGAKARICTAGESKWKVELALTIDGKEYTIIRSGSSAKVLHKGEIVANGNSVVAAWVADNTGSDLDDYLTHTYSKQMETSTLLTMGSAKLQRKVEKLSNVEIVDKVLDRLKEKTSEVNGKLELLAEVDLEEALEAKITVKKSHEKTVKTLQNCEEAVKNNRTITAEVTEDQVKRRAAKGDIATHSVLLDGYTGKIHDALAEKKRLLLELAQIPEDLEVQETQLQEQVDVISDALVHKVAASQIAEQFRNHIVKTELWLKETGIPNLKEELRLDPLIEKTEGTLSRLAAIHGSNMEDYSQAALRCSLARDLISSSECPTCHRAKDDFDLEAAEKSAREAEANRKHFSEKSMKSNDDLCAARDEVDALDEQYPGEGHKALIDQQELILVGLKEELEEVGDVPTEEELSEMRIEIGPLQAELKSVQAILKIKTDLLSDVVSVDLIKVQSKEGMDKAADALKQLELLPSDPETLDDVLAKLKESLEETLPILSELREEERDSSIALAICTKTYEDAKKSDEQFRELKSSLGLFTKLAKYLRESRTRFLSSVWEGILSRATEIVSGATAGNDDQITQITRDKRGAFMYVEREQEFSIADASGCQMEMMGVAVRLALCDLFYGYGSYMMLDEASSQMNEENAAALAGVLAATGKQIIYVTHRETEETAAKNVIILGEM